MQPEMLSHDYGFENPTELDGATPDVLNKVFQSRLQFVDAEYRDHGQCTSYYLDQILTLAVKERKAELGTLELDLNLFPEPVTIRDLPYVKETRRQGKIQQRQNDIAEQVRTVATQIHESIDLPDVKRVTVRLTGFHRDRATNADVYPRILGGVQSIAVNGTNIDRGFPHLSLSIPLSMIIQAGPQSVRFLPKRDPGIERRTTQGTYL